MLSIPPFEEIIKTPFRIKSIKSNKAVFENDKMSFEVELSQKDLVWFNNRYKVGDSVIYIDMCSKIN